MAEKQDPAASDQALLDAMNEAFERLRANEPEWLEFRNEIRTWDAASDRP